MSLGMQLLGIRTTQGGWSWILRGADGATMVQSTGNFGSYALAMIDASCVYGHLQVAEIECSDILPMLPLGGGPRER